MSRLAKSFSIFAMVMVLGLTFALQGANAYPTRNSASDFSYSTGDFGALAPSIGKSKVLDGVNTLGSDKAGNPTSLRPRKS